MNFRRLIRRLTHPFVKTYFVYNDKVPSGFLTNDQIPDVVFNRDVQLSNCGVNKKLNVYSVIATPLDIQSEEM